MKKVDDGKWVEAERKESSCGGKTFGILESSVTKYNEETTLHGFQYLNAPGIISKLFWFAIVSTCLSLGAYLGVYQSLQEYLKQKPMTYIGETTASLSKIIFPSVTLCNINQVQQSILEKASLPSPKDKDYLIDYFYLGANSSEEPVNWNQTVDSLEKSLGWNKSQESFNRFAAQKCTNLMMAFNFQTLDFNTKEIEKEIKKSYTDYGICCKVFPQLLVSSSANTYRSNREVSTSKYRALADAVLSHPILIGTKNGERNGLTVLLDIESYEYSYFPRGGVGLTIGLSDLGERTILRQEGFRVAPGMESIVSLDINGFEATPNALGFFTGAKRFCYTEQDFQPRHYNLNTGFVYSMSNCLYSSLIDKIEEKCHCSPIFANLPSNQCCSNITWCLGSKLKCMENQLLNWGDGQHDLDKAFNMLTDKVEKCLPGCYYQKTKYSTTNSNYPSRNTFPNRKEMCLVIGKVDTLCKDPIRKVVFERHYEGQFGCNTFSQSLINSCLSNPEDTIADPAAEEAAVKYAADNLVYLKIFIKDPFYTRIKIDQRVTILTFLGNAGGMLGLLTGLSVMSIVEIFYHGAATIKRLCSE